MVGEAPSLHIDERSKFRTQCGCGGMDGEKLMMFRDTIRSTRAEKQVRDVPNFSSFQGSLQFFASFVSSAAIVSRAEYVSQQGKFPEISKSWKVSKASIQMSPPARVVFPAASGDGMDRTCLEVRYGKLCKLQTVSLIRICVCKCQDTIPYRNRHHKWLGTGSRSSLRPRTLVRRHKSEEKLR